MPSAVIRCLGFLKAPQNLSLCIWRHFGRQDLPCFTEISQERNYFASIIKLLA